MMIVFMSAMPASCAAGNEAAKSPEYLYRDAVWDAAFADDDEILPLISLVESDYMAGWTGAASYPAQLKWIVILCQFDKIKSHDHSSLTV